MTREEAITRLHWLKRELIKGTDMNEPIDMAIEALSEDKVLCKDCKHRFYDKQNDCYMCHKHEYGEVFEDDDFCSWAERSKE